MSLRRFVSTRLLRRDSAATATKKFGKHEITAPLLAHLLLWYLHHEYVGPTWDCPIPTATMTSWVALSRTLTVRTDIFDHRSLYTAAMAVNIGATRLFDILTILANPAAMATGELRSTHRDALRRGIPPGLLAARLYDRMEGDRALVLGLPVTEPWAVQRQHVLAARLVAYTDLVAEPLARGQGLGVHGPRLGDEMVAMQEMAVRQIRSVQVVRELPVELYGEMPVDQQSGGVSGEGEELGGQWPVEVNGAGAMPACNRAAVQLGARHDWEREERGMEDVREILRKKEPRKLNFRI